MNEGEYMRDLKLLQVDRRFKKFLSGRKQSMCSRSSSGRWDQILGSISGKIAEAKVGGMFLI